MERESLIKKLKEEITSKLEQKFPSGSNEVNLKEIVDSHTDEMVRELDESIKKLQTKFYRAALRDLKKKVKEIEKEEEEEYFIRFNIHFRIQHIILFSSVILLILTGIPLKFPDFEPISFLLNLFGGIKNSRVIHRIAASGLIFFMIYHMLWVVFHPEGRRDFIMLIPGIKDFKDFFQNIKYFLGWEKERPKFDRFSYIEKFDYWAVYWGCMIMIGSGLFLWFMEPALKIFPKYIIDIAKEAHSDEALLATLAIVIWHFYNVHFNPSRFPGTLMWLHGKISLEEMKEEHPLEYERIMKERERERSEHAGSTDKKS